MAAIVTYVTAISRAVVVDGFEPLYRETMDTRSLPEQVRFKVSLGVIPDFTYEGEGFCAGTVIKGRPSHKAGMQDGDVVLKIDRQPVKDIESYMKILGGLEAGQIIHITILRNGQIIELEVQL